MSALDILIGARALIAEPEHWTKGSFAKDSQGVECNVRATAAYCWCAEGAIAKASIESASGLTDRGQAFNALERTTLHWETHSIACFNDDPNTTHAMVIDAFDLTIAHVKRSK